MPPASPPPIAQPLPLGHALWQPLPHAPDTARGRAPTTGRAFATFERDWHAHLRKQPYPKELIPQASNEKKEFTENTQKASERKGRDISFGDFAEVREDGPRQAAHLGELMRERKRLVAAAELYGRAVAKVGSKYESINNKYAKTLVELKRYDDAKRTLEASPKLHPGSASTHVHLGRIALARRDYEGAKAAWLEAVAVDPFDPDIHLGLTLAYGRSKIRQVRSARRLPPRLLLGVEPAKVEGLAQRVALGEWEPPPESSAPDAG